MTLSLPSDEWAVGPAAELEPFGNEISEMALEEGSPLEARRGFWFMLNDVRGSSRTTLKGSRPSAAAARLSSSSAGV
jgi:hypothetical protein